MANRRYNQFRLSLENAMVDLYLRATIGATGAPTLVPAKSKGIASIARTGVGAYTITLQDTYVDLFHIAPMITLAAGSPVSGAYVVVRAQAVATTAKTIQIALLDGTAAAAELPSGATLGLKLELKNSSV